MNTPQLLTLAFAQVNLLVGDVHGNLSRTLRAAARARDDWDADLILFPELTLSGYPPEDLLFHRGLRAQIESALEGIGNAAPGIGLVIGFPEYQGTQIFNSAAVYRAGVREALTRKSCLPNYRVFDEKRYFTAGDRPSVFDCNGFRIGLLICEDIWESEPAQRACADGAELLLVINASPFEMNRQLERERVVRTRAAECGVPSYLIEDARALDPRWLEGVSSVGITAGASAPDC